jgi:hypothetical protein
VSVVYEMIPRRDACIDCGKFTSVKRMNYPAMGQLTFYCRKCQRENAQRRPHAIPYRPLHLRHLERSQSDAEVKQ